VDSLVKVDWPHSFMRLERSDGADCTVVKRVRRVKVIALMLSFFFF